MTQAADERAAEVRAGLAHLSAVDPVLARLIDLRPDYDPDAWRAQLPDMDLFGCLVFQVIGQQISVRSAAVILERLRSRWDGALPSPEQVMTLAAVDLRSIGCSWRKAATILELAARFADGRLDVQRLAGMEDDDVIRQLTAVPGIGPWTVQGALLISLRRPDVVATGDVMLQNAVQRYYRLESPPTEAQFEAIAAPWRPYRSLGVNLLFAAWEEDARAGMPTSRARRGRTTEPPPGQDEP